MTINSPEPARSYNSIGGHEPALVACRRVRIDVTLGVGEVADFRHFLASFAVGAISYLFPDGQGGPRSSPTHLDQ